MVLVTALVAQVFAVVIDLDEMTLKGQAYWDGADGKGGFYSGPAWFNNTFTRWPGGFTSWEGFAYSSGTDTTLADLEGQYHAIAGHGQGNSRVYAIGFVGWTTVPTIQFARPVQLVGAYITNVDYTYYALLNGNAFCKRFGGADGQDPDWLLLTITGFDDKDKETGQVQFYLADLRSPDPATDFIVTDWKWVDLSGLGPVRYIRFEMASSDTGPFGMNTPAYFALDSIVVKGLVPSNTAVPGIVDPDTLRPVDSKQAGGVINPIFMGWATAVIDYNPADQQWSTPGLFDDPNKALGPATGDPFDIVSLGELDQDEIKAGKAPGHITLSFEPLKGCDRPGLDIAVFENGLIGQDGRVFAELAYVEVSTNGRDFARFPSLSLTQLAIGPYGTLDPHGVFGLPGAWPNAYGRCLGTGLDLQDLIDHPLVRAGLVDLNDIRYVRIVDVPGLGCFLDQATAFLDPSNSHMACYQKDGPIYDPWPTWGSGGFDLEAVGLLRPQLLRADINLDGLVDNADLAILSGSWQARYGQPSYKARADLNRDLKIDELDLEILSRQWLMSETWRLGAR